MPKAHEIAAELRRIADSIEREPETEMVRPMVSFYNDTKEQFLATARLFPRPLHKDIDDRKYGLENADYRKGAVWLRSQIDRNQVCTLIKAAQPAVYDCEALLSEDEESTLV